jgi:hypothetical protein
MSNRDVIIPIWRFARAFGLCVILISQAAVAAFSDELHEIDGTLVRHGHGFGTVLDTQCHYHSYDAPPGKIVVDGVLPKNYLSPPIAGHFVVGPSSTGGERIISIARKAVGAPRNCSVYSDERTVDGFLTGISEGNASGGIFVETDTGDTMGFSYAAGRPASRIRFNGKPFVGCMYWPQRPCDSMSGLTPRMRVRVRYNVQMVDGKRFVNPLSVDSISARRSTTRFPAQYDGTASQATRAGLVASIAHFRRIYESPTGSRRDGVRVAVLGQIRR